MPPGGADRNPRASVHKLTSLGATVSRLIQDGERLLQTALARIVPLLELSQIVLSR